MALTPENYANILDGIVATQTEEIEPSKTWMIDFANGTIGGFIDDKRAIKQFIHKAIITERNKYAIYSDVYGNELPTLIGESYSTALLDSEIPRMVYEAITYDERIDDATVDYTKDGDKVFITVVVELADTDEQLTEEVEINGLRGFNT